MTIILKCGNSKFKINKLATFSRILIKKKKIVLMQIWVFFLQQYYNQMYRFFSAITPET